MRIALIDTTAKPVAYPVALLKIGAWRRAERDECRLFTNQLPEAGTVDEIWLSATFTFDIPHALGLVRAARQRAPIVRVGGVAPSLLPAPFEKEGVLVHRGLLPEAELCAPDYRLLGHAPEYSISHTSRGCVRKCGFCMVHRLEPEFVDLPKWPADLSPAAKAVRFYDNNWLAKPLELIRRDADTLRELVRAGRLTTIDFNQGLDCRLITEEMADILRGLPIRPIRFAFDNMAEDGYYQAAVELMVSRGFTDFRSYVLFNFNDTPADFYYRLRESARLAEKLKARVESFPMRFQPILEVDQQRTYTGRHWTARGRAGFRTILAHHVATGNISCDSVAEFEYWYGRDAAEFERLISYPKIRQLCQKKKGNLRMQRATGLWKGKGKRSR